MTCFTKFPFLCCLLTFLPLKVYCATTTFNSLNSKAEQVLGPNNNTISNILKLSHLDLLTNNDAMIKAGLSMFYYAGAAYCTSLSEKNVELWKCGYYCDSASPHTQIITVFSNHFVGTGGFIAIDHKLKQIIVSFKGSITPKDWLLTNTRFTKSPLQFKSLSDNGTLTDSKIDTDNGRKEGKDGNGPLVHTGFLAAYNVVSQLLITKLNSPLIQEALRNDYILVVVGHSMGGALATLGSLDIVKNNLIPTNQLRVITYGEPKVGNKEFVSYYNSLLIPTFRFVNVQDWAPRLPPLLLGFIGLANKIYLSTKGLHIGKAKLRVEVPLPERGVSLSSLVHHVQYFGIVINPLKCKILDAKVQ